MPKNKKHASPSNTGSGKLVHWVRGIIVAAWLFVLVVYVPRVVVNARNILRSALPEGSRRAALEALAYNSGLWLVVALFIALAVLGYGVYPRKWDNVWSMGGPFYSSYWVQPKRRRSSTKRRKDPPSSRSDIDA